MLMKLISLIGEKKFKLDEFLPIYSDVKKNKDMGTYEDFMECMKLYDKSENGLMIGAELFHILVSLGQFSSTFIEGSSPSLFLWTFFFLLQVSV